MELRLFNRGKDLRFVRPHRVAFFEWLRTMRHNLLCDWNFFVDTLRQEGVVVRESLHQFSIISILSVTFTKLQRLLNGRQAAEHFQKLMFKIKNTGIGPVFWPLILALGLIAGYTIKWQAESYITMGHEDYKLKSAASLYDLNVLEKKTEGEWWPADPL